MSEAIEIGPARSRDADAVARMSRERIEHGLRWRWTPDRVLRAIRDPETLVLVARQGERVVGFALVEFRFLDARAHLSLLAVAEAFERRGLGRALLEWIEPVARLGGVRAMALEVRLNNAGAHSFYRSLGWVEERTLRRYYDGVEDALRMTRTFVRRQPAPAGPRA